ncbi:MAG: zinc-ribbon domain-containing protein [Sedimentisphaeraceae bacterium JB056]
MFCSKCGKQLADSDKFCPECGEPQYGDQKPDSEFRAWLRQRKMSLVITGTALVVFAVIIKNPPIALIGALIATFSLMGLNKL